MTAEDDVGKPGPDAHLELEWVWVFKLGKRDALLLLKALGGRLANDDEREAASALCDRLTLLREATAREQYRALERAADAVRAKGDDADDDKEEDWK